MRRTALRTRTCQERRSNAVKKCATAESGHTRVCEHIHHTIPFYLRLYFLFFAFNSCLCICKLRAIAEASKNGLKQPHSPAILAGSVPCLERCRNRKDGRCKMQSKSDFSALTGAQDRTGVLTGSHQTVQPRHPLLPPWTARNVRATLRAPLDCGGARKCLRTNIACCFQHSTGWRRPAMPRGWG